MKQLKLKRKFASQDISWIYSSAFGGFRQSTFVYIVCLHYREACSIGKLIMCSLLATIASLWAANRQTLWSCFQKRVSTVDNNDTIKYTVLVKPFMLINLPVSYSDRIGGFLYFRDKAQVRLVSEWHFNPARETVWCNYANRCLDLSITCSVIPEATFTAVCYSIQCIFHDFLNPLF